MTPPTISSLPPDIVKRVCEFILLHPVHWRFTRTSIIHPDLASLALACRSLSGPALDTLWRTLGIISPLLHTLPEDLCTTALMFDGQPNDTELQWVLLRTRFRVFQYSRRVREISPYDPYSYDPLSGDLIHHERRYSLGCHCHIPSAVWDILSAFGPRPLLPNLQSVTSA
ncbi:hypothetical protein TRAPUB_7066 [Trametes pubescens]|uniref:F-box domain-containing protein n=1 Tax=Trametes pubescens TaxID=154538 RepID=A0A1M2V4D2_TRAPU|nr:hypothetical protein TRAPUB_7066 [Trametes pubescens]